MAETILVFGATGKQGGTVVRALLQSKDKFRIRGATRNPDSEKGKALRDQGVEVVKADLNDKQSIQRAVQGTQGVFLVTDTNYAAPDMYAAELQQIKNIADACKEAGVGKVVFSTMPKGDSADMLRVPELESKADGFVYMQSIGLPVAGIVLTFYCENLPHPYQYRKEKEGVYSLSKLNKIISLVL